MTDDRPEGHAPHLEVVALRRPVQKLAIEPSAGDLDWSLFGLDLEDEPVDWSLFGLDVEHEAHEADLDWSLFGLDVEHPPHVEEELDWSLFSLDAHHHDEPPPA